MSEELPQATELLAPKKSAKETGGSLLPLLLDFGPLLIFFAVFKLTQSDGAALASTRAAINGTLAFMAAILVAVAMSKWKLGRVSPMLWLSAVLVVGFGALTVYFNDERFFKMKPTMIYLIFGGVLGFGLLRGQSYLRVVMDAALPEEDLRDLEAPPLARDQVLEGIVAELVGHRAVVLHVVAF